MDRTVLVVLLCLQAFLLITAFTSTDAAVLVTHEDQQLSSDVVIKKRQTSCPRAGACRPFVAVRKRTSQKNICWDCTDCLKPGMIIFGVVVEKQRSQEIMCCRRCQKPGMYRPMDE